MVHMHVTMHHYSLNYILTDAELTRSGVTLASWATILIVHISITTRRLKTQMSSSQWRNYYGLRPGEPGAPQPQWAKWGAPGLGDRAKTLARASDMLQCRFLTIRIL
jgi:hypothetical protein